jgi:DNA-binding LacI/PurR family transcriptional regulator
MPRTTPVVTNDVKLRLEEEISRMPAHAKIRPRRVLMESYGVSRTTIDRAIARLVEQGFLYASKGSGTFVAERRLAPASREGGVTIGVLLPDIRRYTYPGILRGIEHAGFERNVNLVVGNIENRAVRQTHYLKSFIKNRVSGVIVAPARPNPSEDLEGQLFLMLRELEKCGIPFVFCNRSVPGLEAPMVTGNDFLGGFLATRHLLEQGYRRVAYLSHPRYTTSLNRYMGYLSACTLAGIEPDRELAVFSDSWDFEAPGKREMGRLLDGPNPPDAVFCFTDFLALGACRAVTARGLAPGRDIGIVGYDDHEVCRTVDIPLTSVRLDSFELGRRAAGMLFDMLFRPHEFHSTVEILTPELRVRRSSLRE